MSAPKKLQKARYAYSEVVSLVNNYAKDKKEVLELGCGTGNNLVFFAESGFRATGVDVDSRALVYAKKLLKEKGLKARLKLADAARLPYPKASFDLVLDRACLQHNKIFKVKAIIREVSRVLRTGGLFMIIHFRSKQDYAAKNHKLDRTFASYDEVSFINAAELKSLLKDFQIIYLEHLKQEVLLPGRFNRCHYVAVARKKGLS